jgi:nitrite reductase/ring-hydroxylating ferredoxin subunit
MHSRSESAEVCAIGGICTHLGDRSPRVSGKGTKCSWHGSQFDLCSGKVVRGPARVPMQRFETRVRDGWLEVRLV